MKAPKRSKRQKTDSDHEEENQLRTFLKIVPEEEEKINYEVMGTRLMVWRPRARIDGSEMVYVGKLALSRAKRLLNSRDLPRDIPLDSVVVLRYEKRSKSEIKGKVPTEIELVLEQTQQGTGYKVSVSTEGVEELKRKVKIKGEKKEALLRLRQKPERFDTSAGNPVNEILLKLNLPNHRIRKDCHG
ncbi:hypothetical protein Tco_1120735, partial [Tanacetum coccineum]